MIGNVAYNMMLKVKGVRIAGTKGEKECINTITRYLKDINVNYKEDVFPIDISDVGKGFVVSGNVKIEGSPYGLSVPFNVNGRLICIESPEEFQNLNINFKDTVVMIKERPTHKLFKEIKDKGVKGMITVSRTDDRVSSLHLSSWMFEKKCIIPMIDIGYSDGVKLLSHAGGKIKISGAGRTYSSKATSIIANIKGTSDTKETIMFMGHIDSVPFSPGASDNSGGLGIMAELLTYFKKHPIKRNLSFAFFSGEEWGLWGSRYFVSKNKECVKNLILGINIDVAGDTLGNNFCIVTANDELSAMVKMAAKFEGVSMKVTKDIYSSDNMPFSFNGVPTINLFRAGGLPSAYVHTSDDKMEFISPEGLAPLILFTQAFVQSAGNAAINFIEKKIDDSMKKKIEDYFINRGISLDEITDNLPYKKSKKTKS